MYDVAVIGAGIIGTFIARELSKYKLNIILIEKENDVANATTKANSAIVHAGYDAKPGTLKAKFNVSGNSMFDKVCEELDVPFKRIGSLVFAANEEEMKTIKELYNRGLKNKIPHMKILDQKKVREIEPNISSSVIGALYAPTCGIVGPFELAIALAENAVDNGTKLLLNSKVTAIDKLHKGYKIYMGDKYIESKYVINCAGLYADDINNMVASPSFKIIPRRGQYYVLDKSVGNLVNTVIFQCPTKMGKGVLVTQTVHGNLLVGPDAQDLSDKEDLQTTEERLIFIKNMSKKTTGKLPFNKVITSFAGLRAVASTGDFIIQECEEAKNFINVAGIQSPGLTSSPSIAEYVVEILKNLEGNLKEKEDFNPRREIIRFMDLSNEKKAEIIKKDPRYGRIICRCENITEGEIVDAIHRKVGARTVDGVKKRCRPGMGRCQGGFCSPRIIRILARELGEDMQNVVKNSIKSYILTGRTKEKLISSNKAQKEGEYV
jgi:glycerol-3-phosphate dehydrogenase